MTEPRTLEESVTMLPYVVQDPTAELDGSPIPAITTLMFRVCGNDQTKFDEANRIIELFIRAAYEEGFARGQLLD